MNLEVLQVPQDVSYILAATTALADLKAEIAVDTTPPSKKSKKKITTPLAVSRRLLTKVKTKAFLRSYLKADFTAEEHSLGAEEKLELLLNWATRDSMFPLHYLNDSSSPRRWSTSTLNAYCQKFKIIAYKTLLSKNEDLRQELILLVEERMRNPPLPTEGWYRKCGTQACSRDSWVGGKLNKSVST